MTPNKLPPLPDDSNLVAYPVPVSEALRIESAITNLSVANPAALAARLRGLAAQLDREAEALRQSQSLPAGVVASVTDKMIFAAIEGFNEAAGEGELFLTSLRDAFRMRHALADALQADAREKGEADVLHPQYEHGFHAGLRFEAENRILSEPATQPAQASGAAIPEGFCLVPKDALLTEARRLRYRMAETYGLGPAMTDAGAQMQHTAEALEALATSSQETASE